VSGRKSTDTGSVNSVGPATNLMIELMDLMILMVAGAWCLAGGLVGLNPLV